MELTVYRFLEQLPRDETGKPTHNYQQRLCMLDEYGILLVGGGYTESEAIAIDGYDLLIKVAASDTNREMYHIANVPTLPSPVDVMLLQVFTRWLATLTYRMPAPAAALTP